MCDQITTELLIKKVDVDLKIHATEGDRLAAYKDGIRLHYEVAQLGMNDHVRFAELKLQRAELDEVDSRRVRELADLRLQRAQIDEKLSEHGKRTGAVRSPLDDLSSFLRVFGADDAPFLAGATLDDIFGRAASPRGI